MRQAYAHEALLALDGDQRAPGAAVTVELCGHWEHEPPCRVPHCTDVAAVEGGLGVRVLFACRPSDEREVRRAIERALARGELVVDAPEGSAPSRWRVLMSRPAGVADADAEVAARWIGAP